MSLSLVSVLCLCPSVSVSVSVSKKKEKKKTHHFIKNCHPISPTLSSCPPNQSNPNQTKPNPIQSNPTPQIQSKPSHPLSKPNQKYPKIPTIHQIPTIDIQSSNRLMYTPLHLNPMHSPSTSSTSISICPICPISSSSPMMMMMSTIHPRQYTRKSLLMMGLLGM